MMAATEAAAEVAPILGRIVDQDAITKVVAVIVAEEAVDAFSKIIVVPPAPRTLVKAMTLRELQKILRKPLMQSLSRVVIRLKTQQRMRRRMATNQLAM